MMSIRSFALCALTFAAFALPIGASSFGQAPVDGVVTHPMSQARSSEHDRLLQLVEIPSEALPEGVRLVQPIRSSPLMPVTDNPAVLVEPEKIRRVAVFFGIDDLTGLRLVRAGVAAVYQEDDPAHEIGVFGLWFSDRNAANIWGKRLKANSEGSPFFLKDRLLLFLWKDEGVSDRAFTAIAEYLADVKRKGPVAAEERRRRLTEEYSRLSEQEQLKHLRELLLKYRRLTNNIWASAEVSVNNLAYDPETRTIGNEVTDVGSTKHYELRRIGRSYRVAVQQLPLKKKPNVYYPLSIESYDALTGVRRQLDTLAEVDLPTRHHGSISTVRGRAAAGCLFYQYFGDETASGSVSLADMGARFLRGFGNAHIGRIDSGKSTVEVAFDSTTPWGTTASCVETFDLSKAGLLVGMRLSEFRDASDGREEVRRYNLSMSQSADKDGVWIPTRLQFYAWSARQPEKITLHEGVMSDIRLGQLTAKDLEVTFPVGTEVVDRQTETGYVIKEKGQRIPLLDGKEVVNDLKNRIEKMIGQAAPPLPKDGWIGQGRLDIAGRPYLIQFWATWCGSCKRDFPMLKTLAEDGARIIGLHPAGTRVDEIASVLEQFKIGYPTWTASQGESRESARTIAGFPCGIFPYYILVDSNGDVAAHGSLSDVLAPYRTLREATKTPERR